MKTFNSMRRDFLRTGGIGMAAAAIPTVSFAASAQQGATAAAPAQGIFDVRAYGATGDGKTLDTASVNHAIEAAGGECGGDPGTGLARVAAEKDFGLRRGFAQRMAEREADGEDGRGIERELAGDGANAVGAEEFASSRCGHRLGFLLFFPDLGEVGAGCVDSMRLRNVPSARRVVSWSPALSWLVERMSAPSAERTRA